MNRRTALLGLFALLLVGANMRFGVGILAWLAPLPALVWLRGSRSLRERLFLLAVGCAAWTLATLKIITEPMPPLFAPAFGVPIGLALTAPYLVYDALRRRGAPPWAFPLLMVAAEWVLYALTPLGAWGAAAYTQLESPALLQLASVGGLWAIGFVVYAVPAVADAVLARGWSEMWGHALACAALVVAAFAFGQARIGWYTAAEQPTVTVAAVATDADFRGLPLPDDARVTSWDEALRERTRRAAAAGASLVVWTEAATLVPAEREQAWLAERARDARELRIDLVTAYVTPLSTAPLIYENRYVWLAPDGRVEHVYRKLHPVVGEPAVAGDGPAPVVTRDGIRLSGAICYDLDFPDLARAHGRRGVGLLALPASDWRGIDPIHTQIASLGGIEGGFSMVRSTRFGLSAAFDPTGRARAWQRASGSADGVMLVELPAAHIRTVYALLGDWPLVAGALGLLLSVLARRRLRGRAAPPTGRSEPQPRPRRP